MIYLINTVIGLPIVCILIFTVGMLGEALTAKRLHTKTKLHDDECVARAFISMILFIIAGVFMIILVLVNKVL